MRTTSLVTDDDCRPADGLDPSAPGYGAHLPFHAILHRCGHAWQAFLAPLPGLGHDLIVPNVNADFLAEVGPGELDIDVRVAAIGSSSFTIVCDVNQAEVPAARVTVVLVCFDYPTRTTAPLTAVQRAALEGELTRVTG